MVVFKMAILNFCYLSYTVMLSVVMRAIDPLLLPKSGLQAETTPINLPVSYSSIMIGSSSSSSTNLSSSTLSEKIRDCLGSDASKVSTISLTVLELFPSSLSNLSLSSQFWAKTSKWVVKFKLAPSSLVSSKCCRPSVVQAYRLKTASSSFSSRSSW